MARIVEGKVLVVSIERVIRDLETAIDAAVAGETERACEEELARMRLEEEYWQAERVRIREAYREALTDDQWAMLGLEANAGAKYCHAQMCYRGADVNLTMHEDGWAIGVVWSSSPHSDHIMDRYPVEDADLWREILLALAFIRRLVVQAAAERTA